MRQQSTLVLLGLNIKPNAQLEEILKFIYRITPVIERAIPPNVDRFYIMFDKSVPEQICDIIINNPPTSSGIRYSFILKDGDSTALKRIDNHFDRHRGSVLILITERVIAGEIELAGLVKESSKPKHFLNIFRV